MQLESIISVAPTPGSMINHLEAVTNDRCRMHCEVGGEFGCIMISKVMTVQTRWQPLLKTKGSVLQTKYYDKKVT